MDTLTHGLLGAVVGAAPFPRGLGDPSSTPPRAALMASILAAELPDVDYLWPAADPVLSTLQAHRGWTHALLAAPAIGAAAVLLTKLVFRRAQIAPLFLRAVLATIVAHLLPDLWTGWGTRLLLPFSDARSALDWTMVVDPWFTAPLIAGAVWAALNRPRFRRALLLGGAVAAGYLVLRIAISHHLEGVVRARYPEPAVVRVFPAPLAVWRWRYVATVDGIHAAGDVTVGQAPQELARAPAARSEGIADLLPDLAAVPTVREALSWARFPVVSVAEAKDGARQVRVADLRYHLRGQATLAFEITVAEDGRVIDARLDRGGSARDLLRRWRAPASPAQR
jgi:inner membrane protein